jgi:2-oxoglutarate ferredoxin oxidoreductase subunit delta
MRRFAGFENAHIGQVRRVSGIPRGVPDGPVRVFNSLLNRGHAMTRPKLKSFCIQREWCKGCGICVALCPTQVLVLDAQSKAVAERLEACIACERCALRCPDLAISIETAEPEE